MDNDIVTTDLVAELIRRCHAWSRMDFKNFALALSLTLGRTVHRTEVSRWEHGRMVPRADVLLAALAVAGFDPSKLAQEEDPADVLRRLAGQLGSNK